MDEGENQHVLDEINDNRFKRYFVERQSVALDNRGTLGLKAKDEGVQYVDSEYIVFPSEDSFYMPVFLTLLKQEIEKTKSDIVYVDFMHENNCYETKNNSYIGIGGIDSSSFAIRKSIYENSRFTQFFTPGKIGRADGLCVIDAVEKGATHSRIPLALCVHC